MLKIGHLEFDFPVVQAALSGYSDAPMRIIARRYGAPYALHEVILDKSIAISEKGRRRLLKPLDPADHPVAGQLMGAEPDLFAEAARVLVDEGYDVIDINFGCPVKKVLGRHRGGYLLSDPDTAIEIVRRVREVVPEKIPLSLKMRRGMDLSLESERKFFKIFDAAFELGACAITVHGRTVVQKYRGPSDWNFLKRVKQYAGDRTILGSGDLYNADDIRRMLIETGVDGVTVARGCIGNPWIFADCRALFAGRPLPEPPSVAEQGAVIREHFELAMRLHGTDRAARIMRKFGIRYADLHPHPKAVRMAFVAASDPQAWFDVLDRWYDPSENWGPGRRRRDPGELFNQDASLTCSA